MTVLIGVVVGLTMLLGLILFANAYVDWKRRILHREELAWKEWNTCDVAGCDAQVVTWSGSDEPGHGWRSQRCAEHVTSDRRSTPWPDHAPIVPLDARDGGRRGD